MNQRKSFLLRLDPEIYESLERWAQQELRSVNGQIEFLLRQAVVQRERGTPAQKGLARKKTKYDQSPEEKS